MNILALRANKPTVKYASYDAKQLAYLQKLQRTLSNDMKKLGQMRWKSGLVPFSWAERAAVTIAMESNR